MQRDEGPPLKPLGGGMAMASIDLVFVLVVASERVPRLLVAISAPGGAQMWSFREIKRDGSWGVKGKEASKVGRRFYVSFLLFVLDQTAVDFRMLGFFLFWDIIGYGFGTSAQLFYVQEEY